MSDDKTTILTAPNGMLYEIPDAVLARYAVPGERVRELRERMGAGHNGGASAGRPPGVRTGLPPGHSAPPGARGGGGVVLNFFFNGPPPPGLAATAGEGVAGYHMSFDESGIPSNHSEGLLWGDYIDKQGNPAVGYHSHDPVSGNAQ